MALAYAHDRAGRPSGHQADFVGRVLRVAAKAEGSRSTSQLNILVQFEHLMSYPDRARKCWQGPSILSGWWFEVASGNMRAYDCECRSFEVIDRQIIKTRTRIIGVWR